MSLKKRPLALLLTASLLTTSTTVALNPVAAHAATYANAGVTVTGNVSSGSNLTASDATSGTTIKEKVELSGFDSDTAVTATAYLLPINNGVFDSANTAIATGTKKLTTTTEGKASGEISIKVPANTLNQYGTYGVYVELSYGNGQKIAVTDTGSQTVSVSAPSFKDQLKTAYNQVSSIKTGLSTLKSILSSIKSFTSTLKTVANSASALLESSTTTTTTTTTT
ncbi:MAG: hypothetical protein Q3962_03960, partial [Corynebacterium sp.]|nr:hypothetical protein [Corynebacterium sp.]